MENFLGNRKATSSSTSFSLAFFNTYFVSSFQQVSPPTPLIAKFSLSSIMYFLQLWKMFFLRRTTLFCCFCFGFLCHQRLFLFLPSPLLSIFPFREIFKTKNSVTKKKFNILSADGNSVGGTFCANQELSNQSVEYVLVIRFHGFMKVMECGIWWNKGGMVEPAFYSYPSYKPPSKLITNPSYLCENINDCEQLVDPKRG